MTDVAWTTLVLAFFTMLAVVVPVVQQFFDRKSHTSAAMRQLLQMVFLFTGRVEKLAARPEWRASSLLSGLDVVLARALADDIAKAMPPNANTFYVYHALFEGFNALSYAEERQTPPHNLVDREQTQQSAVAAKVILDKARDLLVAELKRRNGMPVKADIGELTL